MSSDDNKSLKETMADMTDGLVKRVQTGFDPKSFGIPSPNDYLNNLPPITCNTSMLDNSAALKELRDAIYFLANVAIEDAKNQIIMSNKSLTRAIDTLCEELQKTK